MSRILFFISFVLSYAVANVAFAQKIDNIQFVVEKELFLQTGMNALDLAFENRGKERFDGHVSLQLPDGLESINGNHQDISIVAGKKRYLSFKLRIKKLSRLKNTAILVSLYDRNNVKIGEESVKVTVKSIRAVAIQDFSEQQYIQRVGDSLNVSIKLFNNGTTDEQVKLLFSSPNKVGKSTFDEMKLMLRAGQDSLITHRIAIERYMLQIDQFVVSVNGLYSSNDFFGSFNVLFSTLSAHRDYRKLQGYNNSAVYSSNYVSLQLNDLFAQQKNYYFTSEGDYRFQKGKLRYGVAMNLVEGYDPILNNTYLEYEKGKSTFTIGNIQENLDATFYGRGVKYSYRDTASGQFYVVGAAERAIDLLGFYTNQNPGISAFAKVILAENKAERKKYEGQIYYDKNNMDSTKSILWTNTFDLIKQKYADRLQIQGLIGAGISEFYGAWFAHDSIRPSVAAGAKMNYKGKYWNFSSDNFVSSAYYPGNRRGAIQLYQRFNRRFSKFAFAGGYALSRSSPEYINLRYLSFTNQTSRFDASLGLPVSAYLNISINPSFTKERGTYFVGVSPSELATKTWIAAVLANLRSKNYKHALFLSLEPGFVRSGLQKRHDFALRGNFNYTYASVGIFGSYQKGDFQIYDLLSNLVMNLRQNTRLSVGSRFQRDWLDSRLNMSVSATYNYNKGYADVYAVNTALNYRVLKNTLITTNFQYSKYTAGQNRQFNYSNLRLGVRKNLKSSDLDVKQNPTGDIRIFCFYDNNNNDIFDAGDVKASDYGLSVDNTFFMTDGQGIALFKNLPFGDYRLFFPLKGEYQAESFVFKLNSRGTAKLEIPLRRVGRLVGQIAFNYDPQLSLKTDLSLDQYDVVARNEAGKLSVVKTDKSGKFEFRLPAGKYLVYVDKETLPASVLYNTDAVTATIEIAETTTLPLIELEVKRKKIEVKKFGQ